MNLDRLALWSALLAGGACVEQLPALPVDQPSFQQLVTVEGTVRRGVDGRSDPIPLPNARLEVLGIGVVRTDERGFYRLPRLHSSFEDRDLEFLVYDTNETLGSPPIGRHRYNLPSGSIGQVSVDFTVGARGSI